MDEELEDAAPEAVDDDDDDDDNDDDRIASLALKNLVRGIGA